MPAKNSVKVYGDHTYHHVYNRGVEKRLILRDEQDRNVLWSYIATYLMPKDIPLLTHMLENPDSTPRQKDTARALLRLNNFSDTIELHGLCLMPNHFHFLLYQTEEHAIDYFMNSLWARYGFYFNKRHNRVGGLFQGVYKGVLVESEEQLLYVTRYMHRNPDALLKGVPLQNYRWSSYPEYLGVRKTSWIKTEPILSFFGKKGFTSYQQFVEGSDENEMEAFVLKDLHLDEED